MSVELASREIVQTTATEDHDDNGWHAVCHCTDDRIAACGLDCSDEPWDDGDGAICPFCALAWPEFAPTCPWGCSCEQCRWDGESA